MFLASGYTDWLHHATSFEDGILFSNTIWGGKRFVQKIREAGP